MMDEQAYTQAGVNIAAGQRATELMTDAVRSTYSAAVLKGIGAFGGLFDATALKAMNNPVLVSSTDGVGTKTTVAAAMNIWDTIGQDLVNHCINDILVQGGKPLFFLDYVAAATIDPTTIATVVGGVAAACREGGCALLGGETAEMPGVYHEGHLDLAGTIVGVVERDAICDGTRIVPGDVLLGIASSGLHTNGYSLARQTLSNMDWHATHPELGCSVGEALLAVHRSYLPHIQQLQAAGVDIRGLAHITGGGIIDNLPRILPANMGAVIHRGAWHEPPIFGLIQRCGSISNDEMFHVFNMGIGMVVVVPEEHVTLAQSTLSEELFFLGEVINETVGVVIRKKSLS